MTNKDAYPLPRVDEALETLAGSCWLTTLDLISGYWQVELHPDDKEKSAFSTPDGLFEFNVMPSGLSNAHTDSEEPKQVIVSCPEGSPRCINSVCPTSPLPDSTDDNSNPLSKDQQKALDPDIGPILKAKENGNTVPNSDSSASLSRESHILLQQWDQLEVHDKVLWRRFHNSDGTGSHLAPVFVNRYCIHAGEISGRFGRRKTLSQLWRSFYWPGHAKDVKVRCRTCPMCSDRKNLIPKQHAQLHPMRSGYPLQRVAVDIVGPFPPHLLATSIYK